VADAAGLHLDAHFSCTGRRNFALDDLKIRPRFGNLCRLHGRQLWRRRYSHRCHKSSYEFFAVVTVFILILITLTWGTLFVVAGGIQAGGIPILIPSSQLLWEYLRFWVAQRFSAAISLRSGTALSR
jgi:hypothetical protein